MDLIGRVERITRESIEGWACFPDDLSRHPVVALMIDGHAVAQATADRPREDLQSLELGRDDMAFAIPVPPGARLDLATLSVVEQETGAALDVADDAPQQEGFVEARHGNRYFGWAWEVARPGHRCAIKALIGNDEVAEARAEAFRDDLAAGGIGDGHCGFSLDFNQFARSPRELEDLRFVFADTGKPLTSLIRVIPVIKPAPMPLPRD